MTLATELQNPLQTEYEFSLPRGYVDEEGNINKECTMRLATAADEILPLKDPRVKNNPAYLTCIVLARTVTKLGSLPSINTKVIENLFASDLAFLQAFYRQINGNGSPQVSATCPKCETTFDTQVGGKEG